MDVENTEDGEEENTEAGEEATREEEDTKVEEEVIEKSLEEDTNEATSAEEKATTVDLHPREKGATAQGNDTKAGDLHPQDTRVGIDSTQRTGNMQAEAREITALDHRLPQVLPEGATKEALGQVARQDMLRSLTGQALGQAVPAGTEAGVHPHRGGSM